MARNPFSFSLYDDFGVAEYAFGGQNGDGYVVFNELSPFRQLTTVDMNTQYATTIQFTFSLGASGCDSAESGDDVYLSYSKNGGTTWTLIQALSKILPLLWFLYCFDVVYVIGYNSYRSDTFLNISMPVDARGNGVRFQWAQYSNDGAGRDVWLVSDVIIGGRYKQ